jgi:hypothetical protein
LDETPNPLIGCLSGITCFPSAAPGTRVTRKWTETCCFPCRPTDCVPASSAYAYQKGVSLVPANKAMTAAERQARFRATHADETPRIRYRRPADRRSRAQRWQKTVAELVALQDDYRTWLDALPQNLEASATAEALRAICDLDLSHIESAEPPRGFGRD